MLQIDEVVWANVPTMIFWMFAGWSFGKLIFRNPLIEELLRLIFQTGAEKKRIASEAHWALHQGIEFHPLHAHKDPTAPKVPLTHDRMAELREIVERYRNRTWPKRILLYLAECGHCHSFAALLMLWFLPIPIWFTTCISLSTGCAAIHKFFMSKPDSSCGCNKR